MLKLIPIEKRDFLKCADCGTRLSVKYTDGRKNYCNKCALYRMMPDQEEEDRDEQA